MTDQPDEFGDPIQMGELDIATKPSKPDNRELVSAALRLLARRDMSRHEFITKLTKISACNGNPGSKPQSNFRGNFPSTARPSSSTSGSRSKKPKRVVTSIASQNGIESSVDDEQTAVISTGINIGADIGTNTANLKAIDTSALNVDATLSKRGVKSALEFSPEEIEEVTAWCAAEGFLNETRFAEGKARSLSARYGAKRVGITLKQKGVAEEVIAETISELKETDLARARAMWTHKFGEPAKIANERNKQIRYLQSRGFGFDVIKRVINGAVDED